MKGDSKMTDAIKRLRDAAYVDDCDGNCEGWDSVRLDDAERILTDAVAAERARILEVLLAKAICGSWPDDSEMVHLSDVIEVCGREP